MLNVRIVLLLAIAVAAGCGYKGPLYLPPETPPVQPLRIPAAAPDIPPQSAPVTRPVPSESAPPPK